MASATWVIEDFSTMVAAKISKNKWRESTSERRIWKIRTVSGDAARSHEMGLALRPSLSKMVALWLFMTISKRNTESNSDSPTCLASLSEIQNPEPPNISRWNSCRNRLSTFLIDLILEFEIFQGNFFINHIVINQKSTPQPRLPHDNALPANQTKWWPPIWSELAPIVLLNGSASITN